MKINVFENKCFNADFIFLNSISLPSASIAHFLSSLHKFVPSSNLKVNTGSGNFISKSVICL